MKEERNGQKTLAFFVLGLFVALSVGFGIYRWAVTGEASRGLLGLAGALFLLVPILFKRLLGGHPYLLYTEAFAFCILAYAFGCVLQWFDAVPMLDKVSHFLSGFVFTTIGYCLYLFLRRGRTSPIGVPKITGVLFGVFFSAFVAVFWEICEFTGYLTTGHDSQHHLTTGVFDTMYDLITCFVGSLLCAFSLILYLYRGKKLVSGAIANEFLHVSRKCE